MEMESDKDYSGQNGDGSSHAKVHHESLTKDPGIGRVF